MQSTVERARIYAMLDVFITGSQNDTGKTIVTAGLAATMQSLGYSTGVYAPVQKGGLAKDGHIEAPDLAYIKRADKNVKTFYSYMFASNELPLIAAEKRNVSINPELIMENYLGVKEKFDCFLVNGTNGIATPIAPNFFEIDLIKLLNLPVLFVISPYTSTINDILIMINHAVVKNVKLSGVIVTDCPYKTDDENIKNLPKLIDKYTDTRVVGVFPQIENIYALKPEDLISYVLTGVNLENVFKLKIAKLAC